MKKKEIRAYEDIENSGAYIVENAKGEVSALIHLEIEYPETKGKFVPKDGKFVHMRACLDCASIWVDDEGICGECGEYRLSKKVTPAYWFIK